MKALAARSGRRGGFSMVELLCAMAVTAILVIVIVQMVGSVLKLWPSGKSNLQKNMEARMGLEFLAQDLSSLVMRRYSGTPSFSWFEIRPEDIGPAGSFTGKMSSLMFFSLPQDRIGATGDVCATAYRAAYQDAISKGSANKTFGLYRTVLSPEETFGSVLGLPDLYGRFWKDRETRAPENFLVGNVVDFRVTLTVAEAVPRQLDPNDPNSVGIARHTIPPTCFVTISDALTVTVPSGAPALPAPIPASCRLVAADVSMTILSEHLSKRLELGLGDTDQLMREGSQTFVKRIEFPGN